MYNLYDYNFIDKNIKRQQIYELYNKYKQNYEKSKPFIIFSNKDLQKTLINEELLNLHDEYIDNIFTTQFKRSITKINELSTALQGKIYLFEENKIWYIIYS